MHQLVKCLPNGAREKNVRDNEIEAVNELLKAGIIYRLYRNGEAIYKLSNNVKLSKMKNSYEFEVVPNRYIGVVFDKEDVFQCVSKDKNEPEIYCLTYALNPEEETVKYFNLGDYIRVKVLARGYDIGNEGLSVRLPRSEEAFYELEKTPCITTGLANGAKPKNTANLDFNETISGCFVEGRKALVVNGKVYYSFKDIDAVCKVYSLEMKNGKCVLAEKCDKKLIRR